MLSEGTMKPSRRLRPQPRPASGPSPILVSILVLGVGAVGLVAYRAGQGERETAEVSRAPDSVPAREAPRAVPMAPARGPDPAVPDAPRPSAPAPPNARAGAASGDESMAFWDDASPQERERRIDRRTRALAGDALAQLARAGGQVGKDDEDAMYRAARPRAEMELNLGARVVRVSQRLGASVAVIQAVLEKVMPMWSVPELATDDFIEMHVRREIAAEQAQARMNGR